MKKPYCIISIPIAIIASILFISCEASKDELTAQEIIDKAIENAGGERYERVTINFTFREKDYKSIRRGGIYQLERVVEDSSGTTKDILSNDGLQRYRNGALVKVPDSMVTRISGGVNSVHYFVQLPYGLNSPAVQKKLLGRDTIKGEPYYEIEISFRREGGGTDYHDEFLYWVHQDDFTINYLAYRFYTNDGGIRFRQAYNPRRIEGIRFVDYKNYKTDVLSTKLNVLDSLFVEGELEFVSDIKTENISVKINN